jgi:D-alanine-D-alanine ligase
MKRVAVLRGGPSDEYDVSMLSGNEVLNALKQLDYHYKDVVITKKGEWLEGGFVKTAAAALQGVDVVFIALHGQFGEDGQVQRILQRHNIPFTGSLALPSAIAFNKELTKKTLRESGINLPKHRILNRLELGNLAKQNLLDEELENLFKEVGDELFIKPIASGSSVGARYIPNKETLKTAIHEVLTAYDQIMIEEFIRGKEAAVGIINNFRNEKIYTLPVIEIVPKDGETHFTREQKILGQAEQIVPGRFTYHEKSKLAEAAALVHQLIDCKDYSRSDFIVRNGEVYFLELNTIPGLTTDSLFPKAAASVGLDFTQLVKHLLEQAHPHSRIQ